MLTSEQLHILQHSTGRNQYGQGSDYRNCFVTGPDSTDYPICQSLVALGLMQDHGEWNIADKMHFFDVTRAGITAIVTESPKPPSQTRSQRRYREYLNADTGEKFGEWLKRKSVVAGYGRNGGKYWRDRKRCKRST